MNANRSIMKKLILAIAVMLVFTGISQAQDSTRKHAKITKTVVKKKSAEESKAPAIQKSGASKKVNDPSVSKTSTSAKTTLKTKEATTLKKDGTPDKRFKANKTDSAVVHLKKNGTADKRNKENKKNANQ